MFVSSQARMSLYEDQIEILFQATDNIAIGVVSGPLDVGNASLVLPRASGALGQ